MKNDFLSRWSLRKLGQEAKLTKEAQETPTPPAETLDVNNANKPVETTNENGTSTALNQTLQHDNATQAVIENQLTSEVVDDAELDSGESEHSDSLSVAHLLISDAEKSVKKAALRKLFLSGEFSEIDPLDDYNQDFHNVKNMAGGIANTLRDWVNTIEGDDEVAQSSESVESKEALVDKPVADERTEEDNSIETESEDTLWSDDISPETIPPEAVSPKIVGQNNPHHK
ncbi:hypothetical protein BCU68_00355 [Vibrio sp. 10N.286.49.B3]|uniref:DUF3306 domain-containing protein n=1 Tax=Vibrio sp. 10N.286.49.B3 TaxID=1880855 RepID=UPI000CC4DA74|nr:DUF3306 domain-containing protein [Vibrio sp. 10N.286.49.B3]PMH46537.1 hypothetical protein BCU68_00355 [Vibrio sp. 10N.286.49.B3]